MKNVEGREKQFQSFINNLEGRVKRYQSFINNLEGIMKQIQSFINNLEDIMIHFDEVAKERDLDNLFNCVIIKNYVHILN